MKKSLTIALVVVLSATAVTASAQSTSSRQDEVKYFQFSLWKSAQVYNHDYSIHGFRVAFLYGLNRDVYGLDVGIAVENKLDMIGFQWGFITWVRRDCYGWQNGVIGVVKRDMKGFQSGFFNGAKNAKGFQLGMFNMTTEVVGFQLGLVNKATWLKGLQIGLINIASDNDSHPILPIVNWNF